MSSLFKWLFILFLFANAFLYAYGRFGIPVVGEPLKSHQALNGDKLKLLSPEEVTAAAQTPPPAETPAAPAEEKPKASLCLNWGMFDDTGLANARKELEKLAVPANHINVRSQEEGTGRFWVYIPPLHSKAEADKKLSEVRAMGVEDGYVMQNDPSVKFAISLGVFSTEEAAKNYLATLREKGVRSAITGERKHTTGESMIRISQGDDSLLEKLVRAKQRFSGTTVKAVDCAK